MIISFDTLSEKSPSMKKWRAAKHAIMYNELIRSISRGKHI